MNEGQCCVFSLDYILFAMKSVVAGALVSLSVLGLAGGGAGVGVCFSNLFCMVTGRFCPACVTNPAPVHALVPAHAPAPAPVAVPAPVLQISGSPAVPTPPQAPAAPSNSGQFQADILASTNQKRAGECAGQLMHDASLTSIAEAYANQLAATSQFQHSTGATSAQYGENLAMQCGLPLTGPGAVDMWYREKQYYNHANPQIVTTGSNMNAHYTALVWKSTTKMGCGSAAKGDCTYIVCNFLQTPNNVGLLAQNVGCP